jgi:hypothetical protein
MVLMYQKDSGLNQGIQQVGSILGGVLMQQAQERNRQEAFKNINEKIKDRPLDMTLLQEILSQPQGMQYLQAALPFLEHQLKGQATTMAAQAKREANQSFFDTALDTVLQQSDPNRGYAGVSFMSPIQEAATLQQSKSSPPTFARSTATLSPDSNVPSVSGVPSTPPTVDSNRVGPREQTIYQQGGQSSMSLNPPQEVVPMTQGQPSNRPMSQQEKIDSLTPQQRQQLALNLARSDDPSHREFAKILNDQAKEERNEDREIRKENRAEIAKYSEPFKDISKLKTSVNKLEKAKELITKGKVSLDENQIRSLANAALGDIGFDQVERYFKTENEKLLFALMREFIQTKEIGGSNPSTREMLVTLSTLPSGMTDKTTNLTLINGLLEEANSKLAKAEDIQDMRKSGRQYSFGEFQERAEAAAERRVKELRPNFEKEEKIARYQQQLKGEKPRKGFIWVATPDGEIAQVPAKNRAIVERDGGFIL